MKKQRRRFNVVLRPEPEVDSRQLFLPCRDVSPNGRTLSEAREMAKDAIAGYIVSLQKHKEKVLSNLK